MAPVTTTAGAPVGPDLFPGSLGAFGVVAPRYASWIKRVGASVLDGAIGVGASFLAFGDVGVGVPFFGTSVTLGTQGMGVPTWTDSGWLVGAVVTMVALQGYLGVTPGKLVLGIAVVRDVDARPVGIVGTVLRWLAHLIDSILMIGFLRPLWHPQHKTFADSLLATVVLDTRRPRRHRWFAGHADPVLDPGPPSSWEAPSAPTWWTAASVLAAIACGIGLLFAYGPASGRMSGSFATRCTMTAVDDGSVRLTGGTLTADTGGATTTRLGVTRPASGQPTAPVMTWEWTSPVGETNEVTLRASFARADGTDARDVEFTGFAAGEHAATVSLSAATVSGLGDAWSWTQTLLVDGVESPACVASAPGLMR
jgi:Mce-associated membrane protein